MQQHLETYRMALAKRFNIHESITTDTSNHVTINTLTNALLTYDFSVSISLNDGISFLHYY